MHYSKYQNCFFVLKNTVISYTLTIKTLEESIKIYFNLYQYISEYTMDYS